MRARPITLLALAGIVTLAAGPAYAQSVGGDIGGFIHMPQSRLLVLRAGMAPVKGRKIVYWRERAFARRVLPPPVVPAHPDIANPPPKAPAAAPAVPRKAQTDMDHLTLDLDAAGLEPLPPEGAAEAEIEAWVNRFIDSQAVPTAGEPTMEGAEHGREP